MTARITRHCLLLLVATLAAWVAPTQAQVVLPRNLISPDVPHDVAAGTGATTQELAIFAWQEFTALNWPAMDPAMDPAATGVRGHANASADFLSIAPDKGGSYPLLVWQTYRHKKTNCSRRTEKPTPALIRRYRPTNTREAIHGSQWRLMAVVEQPR